MRLKQKWWLPLIGLMLLAAGCNFFGQSSAAGIVKTTNGGTDWQFTNKFADATKGSLAGLSISTLAVDPFSKEKVFAGSYNVGLYKSQDSGNTWEQILGRIAVYDFVIDSQNSNNIYVAGSYADHGKVVATRDGGKSWVEIFNEAAAGNPVRTIAIDPANGAQIIIGLNSGSMIKSIDGGNTWKLLNDYQDRINKIKWNNGVIYTLFRSKGLYKSTDQGESFIDSNGTLKGSQGFFQSNFTSNYSSVFYQMAISLTNPNLIFVTSGNALYKSGDGGQSWQPLPVPLADKSIPLRAIAISPSSENIIYVSAGATIYKTLDSGVQWKTQSITTSGFINALLVDPQLPQVAYGGIYIQE